MNKNNFIKQLGIKSKIASTKLANINSNTKNRALQNAKDIILSSALELIKVNQQDIDNAINKKLSTAMIDRLTLNMNRIEGMALSLEEIIKLNDPIGKVLAEWKRPNGLHFQKISVPIGVIGIIYESRPNVTVDASAVAIKAGNSVILRGGKDSFYTSAKL